MSIGWEDEGEYATKDDEPVPVLPPKKSAAPALDLFRRPKPLKLHPTFASGSAAHDDFEGFNMTGPAPAGDPSDSDSEPAFPRGARGADDGYEDARSSDGPEPFRPKQASFMFDDN
jgi:hypothetical protein